ncbi:nucleoside-diphosphate sugar epimerase/dehydratase [Rhodobacter sp. CZR27]|uniref:polysaccharide biosynthesis protein n=1 Tax=Rhodobacter sp. CZR27 TaxID=2033869 RepID=UPI000BBED55E|nr:nucleoside-diphosphate sugar epimerase/dehydratase [Rhodobacter sp. CZR27]
MRKFLFQLVDRLTRGQKRGLLLLSDVCVAPLALFVTGLFIRSAGAGSGLEWMLPPAAALLACAVSLILGMPRIKLNAYESVAILKTAAFASILTMGLALVATVAGIDVPAAGAILFGLLFFILSVAARMAMLHALLWVLQIDQKGCRVLIYGAGNTGMQLAAALRSRGTIRPIAFVDDNPALQGMVIAGLRVHPSDRIERLVRERDVTRVLLAMPSESPARLARIDQRLQVIGVDVHTVPSFAQLVGEEKLVDNLSPFTFGRFLGRQQIEDALPQGADTYVGRSVLVSGAGGSVGSELCRQLLLIRPKRIVMFEISEIALYNIDRELRAMAEGTGVEIVPVLGSVTDARMSRMVMTEYDVEIVFHAAAYKHVPLVESNPIAGLANNVLGTRTLADAAHEAGVARFILVSTDKAVRPTNVMGASKRLAELVIQDLAKRSRGTIFSMVRFGNVLGSSGSVIPLFKEQIAAGGPVTLTHEDVTRFFMTISEAARLVLLAGSFAHQGESRGGDVFVLDMGKPVKIRDLAVQMIEAAGKSVRDAHNPSGDIEIVVTGLRPGEKLHEELLIGEGLLTTPHSKILRAQEDSLSELEMATALRALRSAMATGDAQAARRVILSWVEGYHPPETVAAKR